MKKRNRERTREKRRKIHKRKGKEGESDRVLQRSLRAAKVTVTVNRGARDGAAAESFDFIILLYISRF